MRESFAEVRVENIQCFPLIHSGSCFILEGNQVGKAWFTFSESILATPDYLLIIPGDEDGLWNEALHHLSRDGGEADWMVVP